MLAVRPSFCLTQPQPTAVAAAVAVAPPPPLPSHLQQLLVQRPSAPMQPLQPVDPLPFLTSQPPYVVAPCWPISRVQASFPSQLLHQEWQQWSLQHARV